MQSFFNVVVILVLLYIRGDQVRIDKNCEGMCKIIQEINLRQMQFNLEQVDVNRESN